MDGRTDCRDIVVIGGGPGGYVAAIRAAQLGAAVTLIEGKRLGGTCLNVGCIPTKALLHCAGLARSAREGDSCGIHMTLDRVDWQGVRAYQQRVVQRLVEGVGVLMRKNGIEVVRGTATFVKPKTLKISAEKSEIREAGRIIIATGSAPVMPPVEGLRESRHVLDSTGVLQAERLPESMVVIGGGVIGVELACALRALGSRVTIVEAMPRLLPALDGELASRLAVSLERQGIRLCLGSRVIRVADRPEGVSVVVEASGREECLSAEKILCAVGRRPYTEGLDPEAGGLRCEQGRILTDDRQQTNIPGVYAVGDCTGGMMLAHTASVQGEIAAENAMGGQAVYRPACVPSGVYSFPELAGAGLTEEQAKERGIPYRVGRFPLSANGRALIANGGEGLVKVLVGEELDELLGVHILAPNATELIAEGVSAISMEGTVEELIGAVHAHPTLSEAVREAALAAEGRAIHNIPNVTGGR